MSGQTGPAEKGAYVAFAWYCRCGAKWAASGVPAVNEAELRAQWEEKHAGVGHGEATAAQAAAARRKWDFSG